MCSRIIRAESQMRYQAVACAVKHPIYGKCAELETNMFWRQFFLEASQGRTQRSLFIDSNGNIYKFNKRKNQKPLLSIDEKSPEEIINGAKEFLSKIIGKSGRELLPQE